MSSEIFEGASKVEGDGSVMELNAQGITDIAVMMLPEKIQVRMSVKPDGTKRIMKSYIS